MKAPWVVDRQRAEQDTYSVLEQYGFAVIPNAIDTHELEGLNAELDGHFKASPFSQGLFYGSRTKRFGRVLSRSKAAQRLALNGLALTTARSFLGKNCQEIQLNLTQAIEIFPGSFAQVPHRDEDIWLGAEHSGEMMINAMWALDDFTPENGATSLWPGSHRTPDVAFPECAGVAVTMPRGSVCLFLGSTIHGGGANWSARSRRGLVMSYCLGWLKPCENPWLSYPPQVARDFAPELARLVGYRQDAPSLNNVDGSCPSRLLTAPIDAPAFADHLSPEQIALIEQYNRGQARHLAAA